MPKNKNALIRYRILDKLLSDKHHYYTRNDLWEKCNSKLVEMGYSPVTKRTVELDLHNMDTEFDQISIEWDFLADGKHIIRYEDQTTSIFTPKFTHEEERFLSELFRMLGGFSGLEGFECLSNIQERISNDRQLQLNGNNKPILSYSRNPYLSNEKGAAVSNAIPGLYQAIVNKTTVVVQYKQFCTEDTSSLTVCPYMLKQYNDRWYLICQCIDPQADNLYNLPLDRIFSYEEHPEIDYEECRYDINERFEDIVGVTYYQNTSIERIPFAISKEKAPYIITKPIHGSQTLLPESEQQRMKSIYPELDGYIFFYIECIPNNELKELLFSFDKEIVVLHPGIRSEIMGEMLRQMELYNAITQKDER